ncbi:FAD/NAD(P)-binding domain-containing protein [Periconia macrospinosa]|uniref:FAD/NAD(P)-binding domain-containing protein n=1 Tax=Periconia macrospinosa TaxID=97972 RepID=A0A2V1CWY0_9PLEO|nr:FAD/NAD(P)-binding domain-containing protein [Periconia macrospinosa]
MGLRALGQLGLLPDLEKGSTPLEKFQRIDHQGRDIGDAWFFTFVGESHGARPRVISRHTLMQVFWNNLPVSARAHIHSNKKVSNVRTTSNGVVVSCTDGTSYEGAMVIGADGAYSAVRKHMQRLALEEQQKNAQSSESPAKQNHADEEKPFLTSYRCLWIRFPVLPQLTIGDAFETHGPLITTQLFVDEDSALLNVYEKLPSPTYTPQRWTEADDDPFMDKWRHLPLTRNKLTLGQAYDHRVAAGWINLEEGVVRKWSFGGRVVLVGDAAHKYTPSSGMGCNEGIVDVVVLTNEIARAFSSASRSSSPSEDSSATTTINTVPSAVALATGFKTYQNTRFDLVSYGCMVSGTATNASTWSSLFLKFFDLWILSMKPIQRFFVHLGAKDMARTPCFEFIEGEELIVGKVPWTSKIPKRAEVGAE